MGTITCKYHPRVPARWICLGCDIEFCPACVKMQPAAGGALTAVCPACNNPVDSLGAGNVITPFWHRIPRFFVYPANAVSLVYISLLSMIGAVSFGFSLFAGLLQLVLFIVFLKYAYAVLSHTAKGHLEPPPVTGDMVTQNLEMPFKQLFVFILIGFAYGLIGAFVSAGIADLALVFLILAIPATVMVIAVENSFFKAVNPAVLAAMIRRIGFPYLLLYFFLILLWAGSHILFDLAAGHMPKLALLFLSNFIFMYFLLIMFNMMGYVIYQYHEALGFDIELEYEQEMDDGAGQESLPANPVLSEVNVLINEGKVPEALKFLEEKLKTADADPELHDRYHKLLMLSGDGDSLLDHGQRYIGRLIDEGRTKRALDVLRDCYRTDKQFELREADRVYPLASLARDLRDTKLAFALTNGFAKKHPGHPDIPRLYFLAAKILCEELKQDAKAKALLTDLITKYPNHGFTPEMKKYLQLLENLSN